MRSDRRTLMVALLLLVAVIVSPILRHYLVFSLRLVSGGITSRDAFLVSTTDENSSLNTAIWSMSSQPTSPGESRDEKLGLALIKVARGWNATEATAKPGSEGITPLEDYVKSNPKDIKGRAHLVRLCLNLPSLEKVRDKDRLRYQAERMLAAATEGESQDPQNWYWRERKLHFLTLLGRGDEGLRQFGQRPLPIEYHDFVRDEYQCRASIFRADYPDILDSALVAEWAAVLFPHFAAFNNVDKLPKSRSEVSFRVARIAFGEAIVSDTDSWIKGLVAVQQIRRGLWAPTRLGLTWQKSFNQVEQDKVQKAYVTEFGESRWSRLTHWAKHDIEPLGLDDSIPTSVKAATLGPVYVSGGFLAILAFGIHYLRMVRKHKSIVTKPATGWTILFVAFFISNCLSGTWRFLYMYSLGVPPAAALLAILCIIAIAIGWKSNTSRERIVKMVSIVGLGLTALASPQFQSSAIIIVSLFVIQRGKMPLRPWSTAAALTLASLHVYYSMAFTTDPYRVIGSWLITTLAILAISDPQTEPDEARLAPLTVGLAAMLLGMVMTAQYDHGIHSIIVQDDERAMKTKQKFEGLA